MRRRSKIAGRWTAIFMASLAFLLPARGDITYTLQFDPASSAEAQQVANSVAEAVPIINQYGSFNKHWNVYYNPGIPTAEANYTGYIGCGGTRNTRVIFHEGAHTLGMGTTAEYANLIASGVWAGAYGKQAELDTYNDYADGLHGDGHAIWPGGFNYDNEDGYIQRIWMVRIQAAIRCDMGIMSFNKEAENELVHPGETAEFHVESPVATSYQWYKGAVALSNGGDISGANSDTLRIANAQAADEGTFYCAATGAGETLNSRTRQLFVEPFQQVGQWDMENNVQDSVNSNDGTAYGSPAYAAGAMGQAIDLDGVDDYVALPDSIGHTREMTVVTWVNWDGGSAWQRIFDFGTGTYQYMFLTPQSGSGTLRLVFRDAINGVSSEQIIDSTVLPTGQWVHLAAVLHAGYATLYVNGQAVGSVSVPVTDLIDFLPTHNYIGKSQFNDPMFDGRIDDFQVYNYALDGAEIWNLWGQSADNPPVFTTNPIDLPDAELGAAYSQSVAGYATDADLDNLTFEKADGPAWLSVSPNGDVSGTPGSADLGDHVLHVRVTDPSGASADAEVRIRVIYPSTWVTLNGTAIGTSGSWGNDPAHTKEAAFDGDFNTFYDAVNASGDWTGLDLGGAAQITVIKYAPRSGFASRMIGGQFQGSNTADFSSGVVTLYTIGSSPVEGSLTEQIINDPGTYRYVRYIGPTDGYCNVSEIVFEGVPESGGDTTPPAAPTGLGATAGDATVSLDWADNTEPDLASYTVYRSTTSGSGYSAIASGLGASAYTDNTVANGTTYYYVVTATDTSSNESAASGEASATPQQNPPSTPTFLNASVVSDTQIDLMWGGSSGADSYNVKRSTTSGGPYSTIATPAATSYSDTGLTANTTYYYVVSAVNSAGESANSSEVSATPTSGVSATLMHVDAITVTTVNAGRGNKTGQATVTILDGTGSPVSGVTVSGTFTGSYNESQSGVTDASGSAVINTAATAKGGVSFTFTVDNATESSHTYDSSANVVTSATF